MTQCKVKRWDTVATDIKSLCEEIEKILDEKDVESIQTCTVGRWLILIAIFRNA